MPKDRSRSPPRRQRTPSPLEHKNRGNYNEVDRDRPRHRERNHGDRSRHDERRSHDSARVEEDKDIPCHLGVKSDTAVTKTRELPSVDAMRQIRLLQPMLEQASRWLIKALRHQPRMLNIPGKPMNLEAGGWASVDHVLQALARNKYPVTRVELDWIVSSSNKQRFGISEDGSKIRANQGHSVDVDMQFVAVQPPSILWHGTAIQFCPAIRAAGLSKMARQHVHMSADTDTATKVGSRHGEVVVLKIDAERMHADGLAFFLLRKRRLVNRPSTAAVHQWVSLIFTTFAWLKHALVCRECKTRAIFDQRIVNLLTRRQLHVLA